MKKELLQSHEKERNYKEEDLQAAEKWYKDKNRNVSYNKKQKAAEMIYNKRMNDLAEAKKNYEGVASFEKKYQDKKGVINELLSYSKDKSNEEKYKYVSKSVLEKYHSFIKKKGMKKDIPKNDTSSSVITSVMREKSIKGSSMSSNHIHDNIKKHYKKTGKKIDMHEAIDLYGLPEDEGTSTSMDFSPEGYRGNKTINVQVNKKNKKTGKIEKVNKKKTVWKFRHLIEGAFTGKEGPKYRSLKKILVNNALAANESGIKLLIEKHHIHGDTNKEAQKEFMKFRDKDFHFTPEQRKNANKMLKEVQAEVDKQNALPRNQSVLEYSDKRRKPILDKWGGNYAPQKEFNIDTTSPFTLYMKNRKRT